jgi:hypothetical protein
MTTILRAAMKRAADAEDELVNLPRPRDPIDKLIAAQLAAECESRIRHCADLFWRIIETIPLEIREKHGLRRDWEAREAERAGR